MAREMWTDESELFRAEITVVRQYFGEDTTAEHPYYAGPYTNKSQAIAAITRAKDQVASDLSRSRWIAARHDQEPVKGRTVEDARVFGEVQTTGKLTWKAVRR